MSPREFLRKRIRRLERELKLSKRNLEHLRGLKTRVKRKQLTLYQRARGFSERWLHNHAVVDRTMARILMRIAWLTGFDAGRR